MDEGAKLSVIVEKLGLKNYTPKIDLDKKIVRSAEVNRPALQLNGFFEHFEARRIQLVGMVEWCSTFPLLALSPGTSSRRGVSTRSKSRRPRP